MYDNAYDKAYDNVCREALWRVLHEYGVDGSLIRSMSILCDGSIAYVRLGSREGEYFEVRMGLRQGCVMSRGSLTLFLTAWEDR